jgi:phosphopantothenoylcysteine decarboxylase/phosphopantothenate--cysteine ligase
MAEKTLVLGVTGSIAAFKAPSLIGRLKEKGWRVRVVMTESATHFVHPVTFETVSGNEVRCGMFRDEKTWEDSHVALANAGPVLLVAPATANIIGKAASGIADDLLSATIMAFAGKVIFAPAMNFRMWENPVVRENVEKLKRLGYLFVGPVVGKLASGETGPGRLADPDDIVRVVEQEA